ncbi:MAG TPA: GNAT family N-acetyltransferase [Candidatus Fimimorpha faecalis]|uniref:GNAT family N-acetyltransferase n=1 Tax=Candidatus Fimimorpha faecalis TaxID=2840824 RepID=A0A9D1EDJ9_9FIRM|nr:GNAT family N-acetyltransferase [Candidatus Fimimorpha faecalis]
MSYRIREIQKTEYNILEDFLYEAIFIPEGVSAPPKEIINKKELQVYIADFGQKKGDIGLVAEVDNKIVGAVWARIMNDYGHIDDETPSLAISLYSDYRSCGIGTALMKNMLEALKKSGYKQTSLAVQKANYAVKMYKSVGFKIIDENEEEYIMVCKLCTVDRNLIHMTIPDKPNSRNQRYVKV